MKKEGYPELQRALGVGMGNPGQNALLGVSQYCQKMFYQSCKLCFEFGKQKQTFHFQAFQKPCRGASCTRFADLEVT